MGWNSRASSTMTLTGVFRKAMMMMMTTMTMMMMISSNPGFSSIKSISYIMVESPVACLDRRLGERAVSYVIQL